MLQALVSSTLNDLYCSFQQSFAREIHPEETQNHDKTIIYVYIYTYAYIYNMYIIYIYNFYTFIVSFRVLHYSTKHHQQHDGETLWDMVKLSHNLG